MNKLFDEAVSFVSSFIKPIHKKVVTNVQHLINKTFITPPSPQIQILGVSRMAIHPQIILEGITDNDNKNNDNDNKNNNNNKTNDDLETKTETNTQPPTPKSKLYTLECEGGHYYVGRTIKSVSKRFKQHVHGTRYGAVWTQLHKPIRVIPNICDTLDPTDKYSEDTLVYHTMEKYGIDKVRGGSYCRKNLTNIQKKFLTAKFVSANDRCYNCGSTDHFVKNCTLKLENKLKTNVEGFKQLKRYKKNSPS
jgi:hypothetical protein